MGTFQSSREDADINYRPLTTNDVTCLVYASSDVIDVWSVKTKLSWAIDVECT